VLARIGDAAVAITVDLRPAALPHLRHTCHSLARHRGYSSALRRAWLGAARDAVCTRCEVLSSPASNVKRSRPEMSQVSPDPVPRTEQRTSLLKLPAA
jgi:hypothetical protein